MKPRLPKGVLLDLDDTILDDTGTIEPCWRYACASQPDARIDPDRLYEAIERTRAWYWSDPERHRIGRLDLDAAARLIVAHSLSDIGGDPVLAETIARTYRQRRIAILQPCAGAIETVQWLREQGCRLALVTNGGAVTQRQKVARYGLLELFDTILIEGELGFGKPDPRVYMRALKELNVTATDAWMVGDHLEFDVAQPQKMGLLGMWIDVAGKGVPAGRNVRPNRILRQLSELRP